ALSAGQAKILDLPRLRSQFLALERRIMRGTGKEVVDHPSSGADDLANAVAGALVMCQTAERRKVSWTFWSSSFDGSGQNSPIFGGGGDESESVEQTIWDDEDEARRRAIVRTGNLDYAGRPIEPTSNVPIVPDNNHQQSARRFLGVSDSWLR